MGPPRTRRMEKKPGSGSKTPGKGSFEVTGNEVKVGTFPAGQTVNLGGYWSSQKFAIVGAGVPPVYVYIPSDM